MTIDDTLVFLMYLVIAFLSVLKVAEIAEPAGQVCNSDPKRESDTIFLQKDS